MKVFVVTNCTATGNYTPSIFTSEEKAKGWIIELAAGLIRSCALKELPDISDEDLILWASKDDDAPGWTEISVSENKFFIKYGDENFNEVCLHELEIYEEQLSEAEPDNSKKTMYELYSYIEYFSDDKFNTIRELRKSKYDKEFKSGALSFEMSGTYDETTIFAYDTLEEIFNMFKDETETLSVRAEVGEGVDDWTEEELLQIKAKNFCKIYETKKGK